MVAALHTARPVLPCPVRFTLFGPPTVVREGQVSALPFERRTQLLVLLALRRQWVPRAEVAALLWPEAPQGQAYTNLRKTLFRLDALPWAPAVEVQAGALRCGVDTDVAAFEAALAGGRSAEALKACSGPLLPGFDDGQSDAWTRWLSFERDRLLAAWRHLALARLADPALPVAPALALSARLLDIDPLDETALQHHAQALLRDGQRAAARQACRRFAERLHDELGLEPGAALRALAADVDDSRAPRPGPPAPAPADDGFIGRVAELQQIQALLARPDCRLLCLLGPGGVGKTRLAQRALALLAPRQADGARFVALDDVEGDAAFGQRLAQAAGVARADGDALARALAVWAERRLLLVLDNFEQLLPQAPLLERLLQACPGVQLLVTSRVRLPLAAAWSLPLEGLPCPDPEDDDRADGFDAVRLFVRAAQRVQPGFQAAAERAAVVDLCRRVGGLPLALELAAAWVRVMPCRDIAAELHHGSELLHAEDARHPPRHASFDTVFAHSWRHLSAPERAALAALSVFHGGFTVEAARTVAATSLPVLGALADKSLLARDGPQLRLHPLVQQLAARRLDEAGTRARAEAAHSAWFLRWLQPWEPAARVGRHDALQAIGLAFEDCRHAWAWAASSGDAGDAAALRASLSTLHHYFEHRARFDDGLALMRQALAGPAAHADDALRALLLAEAALMEDRLVRFAEAEATARQALQAARAPREGEARYRAWGVLASVALAAGRFDAARRGFRRALALARLRAQPTDIACTLDNLSLCEKRVGHYDEALRLAQEALAQHRLHGDLARLAVCLNNLASMLTFLHRDGQARSCLDEALALGERHGLVSTQAFVRANLTELALKAHDDATARTHAEAALALAGSGGLRGLAAWLQVQLARLAVRRADLPAARTHLAAGTALTLALDVVSVKPAVLLALAELFEAQHQPGPARRLLAWGAAESSLSAPDRAELHAAWAQRATPAVADAPWPGLTLAEVLARVVAEQALAHAPLAAQLETAG